MAQTDLEESWEKTSNKRHPPEKVMDMLGIKPGLIIGEIGAGRGRFTVHLARRVGPSGNIYANDIDQKGLDYIKARCQRHNFANVETVMGKVDDPLFPQKNLDMIFMVWVYHMLEKPVDLLKSLVPYLKPGATVAMLEPVPAETDDEIKEFTRRSGKAPVGMHSVTSENLAKDAAAAGFELVRTEPFSMDNLFVLRLKSAS
jgi:ubiquinone/menaquinone biosynthesis C-methylase UbiE